MMRMRDENRQSAQTRAYWIMAFLVINMILIQKGNPNPGSRLATLAAMTESQTFCIDDYINPPLAWTNDWARRPDGHYFSNKPPGPMLIGYPVFRAVDFWITRGLQNSEARFLTRRRNLPIYNWVLSFIFQILPFAWISWKILSWLARKGYSEAALSYSAIAILFGNTASVLMNTYFGHGIAAWCLLAMAFFWIDGKFGMAGFCAGLGAVSDYGALLVLAVSLVFILKLGSSPFKAFVLGMTVPLVFGFWYFTACYGKPWLTALQFENPTYLETNGDHPLLLGMFHLRPRLSALEGLLFGSSRGLLFTQPWVLVLLAAFVLQPPAYRTANSWAMMRLSFIVSFVVLLWFNCSFNGWHGGLMIGPRYLSIIFPVFGWLAAEILDRAGPRTQLLLWLALLVSVLLSALIFSTTLYAPPEELLWNYLIRVFNFIPGPTSTLRFLFFLSVFSLAVWRTHKPKIQ